MSNIGIAILAVLILNTISIILLAMYNKNRDEIIERLRSRENEQEREIKEMRQLLQKEKYEQEKAYEIISDYTDPCTYATSPKLIWREMRIRMDAEDWQKFQMQPFYDDVMSYLDSDRAKGNM